MVLFAIKYRRRHRDEVGYAIHGSLALELLWTIIPFFIVMVMFVWGAKVFFDLYRPPAGAMEIYVVGKQWMWKVQHMDGQREINELHVPVGRPVKLIMGSEDVLHSYYIPAFRVKADVIPGRYNVLWFTATKPGTYHLFCAEYCGTKHSGMIGLGDRDGAAGVPGVARRRRRVRIAGRGRRRSCSRTWRATPATDRHAGPRADARQPVRQAGRAAGTADGDRRRGLHPRVDREPAGQDRRRLPAAHADVPGAGHRGTAAAADRVREVAEPARGRHRRRPAPRTDAAASDRPVAEKK